jgi:NAD(P)-dependent dehydrogenase (short-subunit alcohol dehydrogenase family)
MSTAASSREQASRLITGARRGIGAATARLAASRGYAVCVNYAHDHDAAHA